MKKRVVLAMTIREFGFDRRGEVGDERADDYAEYGAGDALADAAFGGGVVGLADEKGGQ